MQIIFLCIILKGVVRKNNLYNVVRNDIFQNLQKNDTEGQVAKMLSEFEEEEKIAWCDSSQIHKTMCETAICK